MRVCVCVNAHYKNKGNNFILLKGIVLVSCKRIFEFCYKISLTHYRSKHNNLRQVKLL